MAIDWSNSTDWLLTRCPRQLWYKRVYASPQAKWGSDRREANILGTVMGLPTWRGIVVHNVIAEWILPQWFAGTMPPPGQSVRHALGRARRQLAFSAQRRFREDGMTKTKAAGDYLALWEDEFGTDDPAAFSDAKDAALDDIASSIQAFYELDFIQERLTDQWWTAWELELSATEGGFPVKGRLDLLTAGPEDVAVVDWKVGESHVYDYAPQLELYAALVDRADRYAPSGSYAATHRLPTKFKSMPKRLVEVNLLRREAHEHDWNDERAILAEDRLFRSARRLGTFADLSKDTDPTTLETAESPVTCSWCPFRTPCRAL